jgi:hypothetical protein
LPLENQEQIPRFAPRPHKTREKQERAVLRSG